jgi:hypothetical protein
MDPKAERLEKIKKNEERLKQLKDKKDQTSAPFFRDTKITTCSTLLMKNG